MKQYIFKHKDFQGGVPAVLEGIKKELGEMIKHTGCPLEEVENKLTELSQDLIKLHIQQRKNPTDTKLKPKIDEIKTKVRSLTLVVAVKQKIEELANYAKTQQSKSEKIAAQIEVYEFVDEEFEEEFEEEKEEEKKSSESAIGNQCIDLMKYAEPMPECFEKSLIRICYLLQLLQSIMTSVGQNQVKDDIAKKMSKDEVLKNLDNDLTQILDLYEQSAIGDDSVEQQMTQSVKSLKGIQPEQRLLNQQQIHLLNLLSKVRAFNFQEFFDLVEVCDKNSDQVKGKDIILLLGTTGAGKSTTIQYLYGAKHPSLINMVKIDNGHIQAKPMPKKLKSFIASAAMKSETRYINPIEFEIEKIKDKKVQIMIVDTPGFGDTQSIEVDIANSLAIIRAVVKANSVRPVFLFSQKNMGGRSEGMKLLIDFYSCMIKNLDSNIESMNFFFSHFADLDYDMGEHMKKVNKELNASELSKLSQRFVLEHMEKLGKDQLPILDPLNKEKRVKLLEQILATKPILNPKKHFTLNILERSRAYLDKQVSLHEKSILEAVSQGQTEQAAFKIDEIKRLAVIFEPYDLQYKQRLQQINLSIKSQVSQKIGLIQERICTCMKPGNQLYESDINKFKEALDFEQKISPLIPSPATKQQEQKVTNIQSDQQQSTMVTSIVNHCTNILAQLDREYKVSDDEWFLFIKKAMTLSANIDGFQHIKKNALEKFNVKFYNLTNSAQEILKKSSIDDYQPQDVEGGPQSSGEEQRVRPNHSLLGDHLINLFQGLKKIKQIPDIDQFTSNLEKYIDEVLQKVSKLTKSIEGNFELDQNEDDLNYKVLTEEKLKKIKKSLEMLERFMSVCKPIDSRFNQAFETIFKGYVQKCEVLFETHQKFFEELQKNLDTKKSTEVNSRFKQIDLLRQIPQIVHKTNGPYHQIISQLKNSVSFSKTEILSIIEELNYFSEQQDGNMHGLKLLFSRLKDALTSIKTLGEAATENSEFMMKMYNNIKESFESLVKRLDQDANMYLDLTPKNHVNIRPLANIYEQVKKIEELSGIINVEVKTEFIKFWLQSIKSTVILIHKECEKLSSKLMDKAEYKALDNYYRFMNELCQAQNSASILLVRNNINEQLQNEQCQLRIDANFMEFINQVIKNQKEFKEKEFNLAFRLLCDYTEVQELLRPEEEQKEINVDNKIQETALQIRDQAEIINKLFKLENDVRHYYDLGYYQNFKELIDHDQNYFLSIYTKQLKSEFFEDLLRPAQVNLKPLKWKYLKLQGLKYLKDIDSYLLESNGQFIHQLFDNLYDQVHFNPPEYLNTAQNEYKDRNFKKIQEMCADLNQPPISQNSANILNKIKEYLSDQVSKEYQQIQRFMPFDKKLKKEEAIQIAQQCKNLMEINSYLEDYILIQGKKILQQIEAVFQYLADCFTSLQEKVEASFQQNNFFVSIENIDNSQELMRVINQERGIQIEELECFKKIKQINDLTSAKLNDIINSIENTFNRFLVDDELKFTFTFSPKSFCENISQIKTNDEIARKLDNFRQELKIKYTTIKDQIRTELQNTEDIETIFIIEQKLQKYKDSLTYVPADISTDITILFSDIIAPHRKRISEKQSKAYQELKNAIIQSQCPRKISQILEQKQKLIQNDKDEELKPFISNEILIKFNAKLKTGNQNIEKYSLQEALQEQVQSLSLYISLPHVQDYVSSSSKQDFYKISSKIATIFTSHLKEFTKYFSETHSERGERIFNGGFQEDHQARNNTFKVLQGVFASLRENKDLVLRECVPDLESMVSKFFTQASDYLRKIRNQHQKSLQSKIPEENIAAINNMKYTSQIFTGDLTRVFEDLKDVICLQKCSDFLQELKNSSLDAMQTQTYNWLVNDYKSITDLPFTESIRDEQGRLKFYREFQLFYDLVTKAKTTEELSIIRDQGQTKIQKLQEEFQNLCKRNINSVVQRVERFNQRIKDNDQLLDDEQEQFGMLYKSLKSMQQTLQIEKELIDYEIDNVEGALKRKLMQLQKEARLCYIDENRLNLRSLVTILCDIQSMNENLVLFEESIQKTLNFILEDYQKTRAKCATAAADLQNYLRGMEGSQGPMLAQNHPFFRGVNRLQANQQFQSKKIDDVLSLIKGTDMKDDDKEDLKIFYEEFLEIYTSIVDQMLVVRYDESGKNKIPMDFSGIIANIKNNFSSESGKRWSERDIQEQIEWGQNGQKKKKITLLLAHIFALWSLMNSEDFKKQQEQDANQANLRGYLLQPHVAQILSILRMMGVGYSEIYRGGSDFNKNWAKVFGNGLTDSSWIRNNLVQIKTGEGKSVVLAIVSIIFALNGFEVNCACYSKYLSTRDYESFYSLFRLLDIQDYITYGTFNELAEQKLNKDGDIRDIIQALVLKEEFCFKRVLLNQNRERRPQVLLIDEVDVFFSKSFYGQIYIPQAQIKHEKISALTDYIWEIRQQQISEQAKLCHDEKQKFPYLSLKKLKETPEYKGALNLFKPEFQFLVEEAAKKMIIDVVEYQSPDHLYVVHKGEIGYENQDQISTNATIGYQTLFAYYHQHRLGAIKDNVFHSKKAIGINCSTFSYAEVPLQYNIILGVTGTLETLSETQKSIIEGVYMINHYTLSPSVHSSDQFHVFNPNSGVIIKNDSSEYYKKLIDEMETYRENFRPVILFFEHNKALKQFVNSQSFKDKNYSYQILNELDSNKDKKLKILAATQARTITLSTKNFGRGTDFCCQNQKVIEAGGLVVIQTFLSQDLSEETQIRGRAARQGTKGTYIMFLNLPDLSKFNIDITDIEIPEHNYRTLCEFRDRKLAREQQETINNRYSLKAQHDLSTKMMNKVKRIIMKNHVMQELMTDEETDNDDGEEVKQGEQQQREEDIDQEKLKEYLLGMNKGITLESDQHFMKVLVLMDITSSMGITLQKTKNCVRAMFDEARNALRDMGLSEDLVLMKIAGYRNYNSPQEEIFQVSPEWTSDPISIAEFLNTLEIKSGWGREAMEIGFQYANKEIQNDKGIPLSMIIVIGDAPPNTLEEVESKRHHVENVLKKEKRYWEKSLNYKVSTNWQKELKKIEDAGVPVHCFSVFNDKIKRVEAEMEKERAYLKAEFSKILVNGGQYAFLEIHEEAVGKQQLKDFFKYLIVYRATEINLGKEKALQSVRNMEVAFT